MQEEKDIYHKCGHLDTAESILEISERKEGRCKGERNTIFMASPTNLSLLGSSSKMVASTYHRNESTQSHCPLLQGRRSHLAQPEAQLNFKTSEITSMPCAEEEP